MDEYKQHKRKGLLVVPALIFATAASLFGQVGLEYLKKPTPKPYYAEKQTKSVSPKAKASTPKKAAHESIDTRISDNYKPDSQKNKKTETRAENNKIDVGIVVISNQNYLYAHHNQEKMIEAGYSSTYLHRVIVNGKKFYRTVLGINHKNLDKILAELREKDLFDTADGFFTEKYEEIKPLITESKKDNEKRVQEMEEDFSAAVSKMSRIDFVESMKKFIGETYKEGYRWSEKMQKSSSKKTLSNQEISDIANDIYTWGKYFSVPLAEFTALLAHEGKFAKYIKGDEKLGDNYSEGMGQMRKVTQKEVFKRAQELQAPGLPKKLPDSILDDERLQVILSACYFSQCIKAADGDIKLGIKKYNGGLSSKGKNEGYLKLHTDEVKRMKKDYNMQSYNRNNPIVRQRCFYG